MYIKNKIMLIIKRQHLVRAMATEASLPVVPLQKAKKFIKDCFVAVGTPLAHAEAHANLLIEADYRGHYSHGMNRLDYYIEDIRKNTCDAKAVPTILKESPASAWVDGNNGLGSVVGTFCMDLAIKKAKTVGIGWVVCKGSNHYGIAGMYPEMAVKEGLLGFSCTNTSPVMVPTRAKISALGTNPLALSAPSAKKGDGFMLDMATTSVAVGKVEMKRRKAEPLPPGWALTPDGQPETNSETGFKNQLLTPLGGSELNSGFKGSGLGMLVEIFCGILGGGQYGPNIRKWRNFDRKADLGHCFIAIDPNCFAPGFETRMEDLMTTIRNLSPTDPNNPVMVAGDPEKKHMKMVDKMGGVIYVQNQLNTCKQLSKELNVNPLIS